MSTVEQASETQIKNIQKKTGKSITELESMVRSCGLTKHSEIRALLMKELNLGYGDANSLVHYVLKSDGERAAKSQGLTVDDVLGEIYNGPKAGLLPIHQKLMEAINEFGPFETAPKKGYVSLRRKRQFAMLGPGTNSRVDVGLNHKSLGENPRLLAQAPGGMCQYMVRVTKPDEVDDELIGWIRQAYDQAGGK